MSYTTDEASAHDGEPVELYAFTLPTGTTRYTSHRESVSFGGFPYAPIPIERTTVASNAGGDLAELSITISLSATALSSLYSDQPPSIVTVVVTRVHIGSGSSRVIWTGSVSGAAVNGREMTLQVPSALSAILGTRIPTVFYQAQCNHRLYDARCSIVPTVGNGLEFDTTIATVAAEAITMASDPSKAVDFYKGGEIVRTSDGERRMIVASSGTSLTLTYPFAALGVGNAVEVYAGCDRRLTTCKTKFSNVINFGGHPHIPTSDLPSLGHGLKGLGS